MAEREVRVIGLTGGIACGKSTVSAHLRRRGLTVVDADLVARELTAPGTEGLRQIKETFGWQYVCPDGTLDRKRLGEKVFAEPEALERLNAIMTPLLRAELSRQLAAAEPPVVLDAALLLENAAYRDLVDCVWVVTASPEHQLERLMARNRYSRRQAEARISAQMPEAVRLAQADAVIDNNGTVEETCAGVDALLARLRLRA